MLVQFGFPINLFNKKLKKDMGSVKLLPPSRL